MLSRTYILVKSVKMNIFHVNNRRGALCLSQGRRMGYPAWMWWQTNFLLWMPEHQHRSLTIVWMRYMLPDVHLCNLDLKKGSDEFWGPRYGHQNNHIFSETSLSKKKDGSEKWLGPAKVIFKLGELCSSVMVVLLSIKSKSASEG